MPALPPAWISHLSAGRLRLKIPDRRHDAAFFRTVADRLAAWDSVRRVEVNPLTAGVLIHFSDAQALIAENAAKNDLFAVALDVNPNPPEPKPLGEQARRGAAAIDAALRRWSGDAADLRGAVLLLLLAGGAAQLLRGNITAPAVTLFWYAGEMLGIWQLRAQPPHGAAGPAAEG